MKKYYNIIIQDNKTQNNVVIYNQYCNSTKVHNKTENIIITYKTIL